MKPTGNGAFRHLPYLLAVSAVFFFVYRDYWLLEKVFTGSDFFRQLVPLINFQSDCLRGHSLPLWNPFMNFGYPWIDHYLSSFLLPTHLVLGYLLRYDMMKAQIEILSWMLLGGLGMYLCVVELGMSRRAAFLSAAGFVFSGQMTTLTGWSTIAYNAACVPFMVLGYHRASNKGRSFSALTAIFFAISIFGGYIAATVLGLYFFTGYALLDSVGKSRPWQGVRFLLVTLSVSMLLALPKLLPFYLAIGTSERTSTQAATDATVGYISSYEFMSLVLPVKYYFSLYAGQIGIMALAAGLLRRRLHFNAALVMFVLSAWLLMVDKNGNISVLHSVANSVLPFMKQIRLEFIYWIYPTFFLVLYLARHIDRFLEGEPRWAAPAASAAFAALMSVLFFRFYNTSLYLGAYLFHLGLAAAWLIPVFLKGRPRLRALLIMALAAVEFAVVFGRVGIDLPVLVTDRRINIVLTHQNHTSQSFMDGERVRELFPRSVLRDDLRPEVDESRQWPFFVLNAGGEFMSTEPLTNPELMNQKVFTGVWYNSHEKYNFARLKYSPYFWLLGGQPLYSFKSSVTGDSSALPVSFDEITCSGFAFGVDAPEPGYLVLDQMYDKRWEAYADGERQPTLLHNDYFMGVRLGPGRHDVKFVFRDRYFELSLAVSALTLAAIAALPVARRKWKRKKPAGG